MAKRKRNKLTGVGCALVGISLKLISESTVTTTADDIEPILAALKAHGYRVVKIRRRRRTRSKARQ